MIRCDAAGRVSKNKKHKCMYSQTYASVIVLLLAQVLPKLGVVIGTEELTTTVATVVTIVSGLWIAIRRYQAGDVSSFGFRK